MSVYHINMTDKCNLNCKFCYARKSKFTISKETLNNTIDYIINDIKLKEDNSNIIINFMGGEIGLIDPLIIEYAIHQFIEKNQNIKSKILFDINTNLVYKLTEKHLNILKYINILGVSWDYKLRFDNLYQEKLWLQNIKKIQDYGFNKIKCLVTLTKDFISNCSPNLFLSFMLSTNIKIWEFNKLTLPINGDYDEYMKYHISNRETENWLYEMFLNYEKIKKIDKNFIIETFDCIIDSTKEDYYYVHSRTCQNDNKTISPNGDVAQCVFTSALPFYNVNNKKLNYNNYDKILDIQNNIKDECLNCPYYKWCKGDCCLVLWDETGCATPKKIYEYILNKKE